MGRIGRPKLYDRKVLLPLTEEQYLAVRRHGAAMGMPMNDVIRAAIDDYFKEDA